MTPAPSRADLSACSGSRRRIGAEGRRPLDDFGYVLPEGRIARYPAERRDESRLLVVPRPAGPFRHLAFRDLPSLMRSGDVLVVNESRVLPVRLLGAKPTGARAEIFLLRPLDDSAGDREETAPDGRAEALPARRGSLWEALVRPGGKLKPGRTVEVAPDLVVRILDSTPERGRIVRLDTPLAVEEALDHYGHVPLPPYLGRSEEPLDRTRYQTVYARTPGSVAAPTAGFHFTPELLAELEEGGVTVVRITLHVGVATFRPAGAPGDEARGPGAERYHIPRSAAARIGTARARGGRVWAVGTTVVRALESAADGRGGVVAGGRETRLFIRPPFDFQVVDALVTNFHLPYSTLLMLVAAFAGYRRTMAAYREAVEQGYRFYSYGDAMVIP